MGGPAPAVAAVRLAVRGCLADLGPPEGPRGEAPTPAALVLVACSGGADSLALAAALAHCVPRAGLRWGGLTVDHGLQPGSAAHAEEVARTLRGLGAEVADVLTVRVEGPGGPEAAARSVRYGALTAAADGHHAAAVLLGHTRDDQAETVLLGLARGSGARSLAGMPPRRARFRRPLLGLTRATTAAACAGEGLRPWVDPQNGDAAFSRVRVRTAALPALEAALGPGVAAALARTADLLRDDADALEGYADGFRAANVDPLAVAALAELPRAVRTRVLLAEARAAGCPPTDLRREHLLALDALVTDWHGQGPLELPGGIRARRSGGRLAFGG